MVLGYYKSKLKTYILQSFSQFKLRKRNSIGRCCKISKKATIGTNCHIRDFVVIGEGTVLSDNVTIGSRAKINNISIGRDSHIEGGVICTGSGNGKIEVGEHSYIGVYNILDWSDNITIGDHVHIAGPSTGLWTHSSMKQALEGLPLNDKRLDFRPTAPILIESNVYIGGNCTIYPEVTIGHHSVVAPNSAVNKNVEPYTMVGGVPAKVIKKLNDE